MQKEVALTNKGVEDLGKAGFVKSPMPGTVVKIFCKVD